MTLSYLAELRHLRLAGRIAVRAPRMERAALRAGSSGLGHLALEDGVSPGLLHERVGDGHGGQ